MKTRRIAAVIALFLVATAWGATFTLIKDVLGRIAPEPFIFYRFTIAGLVLCAIAAARRRFARHVFVPGLILGMLIFVGYWAQTRGLMFITPSRSALLTGLYVVMVPFADRVLHLVHAGGQKVLQQIFQKVLAQSTAQVRALAGYSIH